MKADSFKTQFCRYSWFDGVGVAGRADGGDGGGEGVGKDPGAKVLTTGTGPFRSVGRGSSSVSV
jgi:hypothetical protein